MILLQLNHRQCQKSRDLGELFYIKAHFFKDDKNSIVKKTTTQKTGKIHHHEVPDQHLGHGRPHRGAVIHRREESARKEHTSHTGKGNIVVGVEAEAEVLEDISTQKDGRFIMTQ